MFTALNISNNQKHFLKICFQTGFYNLKIKSIDRLYLFSCLDWKQFLALYCSLWFYMENNCFIQHKFFIYSRGKLYSHNSLAFVENNSKHNTVTRDGNYVINTTGCDYKRWNFLVCAQALFFQIDHHRHDDRRRNATHNKTVSQ